MFAVPIRFVTGVIVTFRLVPEPLKMIFVLGTSVGLDDPPLTDKFAVGRATSLSVKLIGAVAVLCTIVWSPIGEILRLSFTTIRAVAVSRSPNVSVAIKLAV